MVPLMPVVGASFRIGNITSIADRGHYVSVHQYDTLRRRAL